MDFDSTRCSEMTDVEKTELNTLLHKIATSIKDRSRALGGNDSEVNSSLYTLQDWLDSCGVEGTTFSTPNF